MSNLKPEVVEKAKQASRLWYILFPSVHVPFSQFTLWIHLNDFVATVFGITATYEKSIRTSGMGKQELCAYATARMIEYKRKNGGNRHEFEQAGNISPENL